MVLLFDEVPPLAFRLDAELVDKFRLSLAFRAAAAAAAAAATAVAPARSEMFDEDDDERCTFGLDISTSRPFEGETGTEDSFFGDLGRVRAKACCCAPVLAATHASAKVSIAL